MKFSKPLLRLPIDFDAAALAGEIEALPAEAWRPHPDRIVGNEAVPLVSPGGEITDSAAGAMAPTRHLLACSHIMQAMAELGAVWGRSRLMRLAPGAVVPPHIDINYYWRTHLRIHIPIITTPEVLFTCSDETVHMKPGECWIFDTWREHQVVNGGARLRTHLVLDTVGGERLWDLIEKAQSPDAAVGAQLLRTESAGLRFEQINAPHIMSPWEIRGHIAFVMEAAEPAPLLDAVRHCLDRFAFCWAAVWAEHGASDEGLADYQRLLLAGLRDLDAIGGGNLLLRNGIPVYRQLALLIFKVAAPLPHPA